MVTRVTGHLRLIKSYFKELSFIHVALYLFLLTCLMCVFYYELLDDRSVFELQYYG